MKETKHLSILVWRYKMTDKSTVGKMYLNDEYFCHTLEDVIRDKKIKHETCIDEGKYDVKITYSPKYKRQMPLILDVDNYSGIRLHSGNTDKDTSGCILVGYNLLKKDYISNSRKAYKDLMIKMDLYDTYSIEIVNILEKEKSE